MKHLALSFALIALVFFTGCSQVQYQEVKSPAEVAIEVTQPDSTPEKPVREIEEPMLPVLILKIEAQSQKRWNAKISQKEIDRNNSAALKGTEVIRGECFKKFWLDRKLIQTNGKTNQEVLDHLSSSVIPVNLIMYRTPNGTHGYTYKDTKNIWLNRRWHDNYGVCTVASNLHHEGSHKIGYKHDSNPNLQRPFSVPYSINAGFTACCRD